MEKFDCLLNKKVVACSMQMVMEFLIDVFAIAELKL
jgi:hypothetical protein